MTWRVRGVTIAAIGLSMSLLPACGRASTAAGSTASACRTFALSDARRIMGPSIHSAPKTRASTCVYAGPADERLTVAIAPNTAAYRRGIKLGSIVEHAGAMHRISIQRSSAEWQAITTALGMGTLAVASGYGHLVTVQVTGTSRTTLQAIAGITLLLRNLSNGARS